MLEKIDEVLHSLEGHPDILAVVLLGSVSMGAQDDRSDVDLLVIYQGDAQPELQFPETGLRWDVVYETLEEFKNTHKGHWTSHAFLTAKVIFDKTNEVSAEIQRFIEIPAEERTHRVAGFLDAYLNAFYRSMKAARRNNRLGAILQASDSVRILVACLYVMNGFIPPYQDRIQTTVHLLKTLPLPPQELCERFTLIASTADPAAQSGLFRQMEAYFRRHGFGHVYDAWGDMLHNELVGVE